MIVEIVAVKALWNTSEPQLSIAWPQRIQSKAVIFHSISTRFNKPQELVRDQGSEVQILSPRPQNQPTYDGPLVGFCGYVGILKEQNRLPSLRCDLPLTRKRSFLLA